MKELLVERRDGSVVEPWTNVNSSGWRSLGKRGAGYVLGRALTESEIDSIYHADPVGTISLGDGYSCMHGFDSVIFSGNNGRKAKVTRRVSASGATVGTVEYIHGPPSHKETRSRVRFSHQAMDALTNPDGGERVGNAIRGILENPKSPGERLTDRLKEEDKEQLRQLVGRRVRVSYSVREPITLRENPPLVLDRRIFVLMQIGNKMVALRGAEEQTLQELGIPRIIGLDDTEFPVPVDITFTGIEDQGGEGVLLRLRKGKKEVGLTATEYALTPGLVEKAE